MDRISLSPDLSLSRLVYGMPCGRGALAGRL